MKRQSYSIQFGLVLLLNLVTKTSLGCGGMVFPGSYLCAPTSGYSNVTATLMYVPTSWLGGSSQPISYPPNPLAPKTNSPGAPSYPSYGYGSGYPSYGYGSGYPSYGYGSGYPSYGYGSGYPSYGYGSGYPSYGGLMNLGSLGGGCGMSGYPTYGGLVNLAGLAGCGSAYPSYGGYNGYGGGNYYSPSYPIQTAPVVTVVNPGGSHGCAPTGVIPNNPAYSEPRPVCVQFCGMARNLLRPIARGHIRHSNRFY